MSSRILLTTAALGQIVEESIVTDVFQSIAKLPGGVQQRTSVVVEYSLGVQAPTSFRQVELGPPSKGRAREGDRTGDAGNN